MVICAIAKIFLEGRIRGEGFVFEGRVILMDLEVLFERRNARWLFLYTFTLYIPIPLYTFHSLSVNLERFLRVLWRVI